jgi:hypothetical protein
VIGVALGISTAWGAQPPHHAPIRPLRTPNGLVATGARGEISTGNWSGYAVASYQTGQSYTGVEASWTVPAVGYGHSTDTADSTQSSSLWIGIGGFCENAGCAAADATLIQIGTEQDATPDGSTDYYAWWEVLPARGTRLRSEYVVHPGDQITASVRCIENCHQSKQTWQFRMVNLTEGWLFTKSVRYGSSELSAEAIMEAPSGGGGILPLPDYGTAAFSVMQADGAKPHLSISANGIAMQDPWGQTSSPSMAALADAFDTCYGFEALTVCTEP